MALHKNYKIAPIGSHSALQIMKGKREGEVKQQIMNHIIDEQVRALRKRLEIEIKPLLQSVTFDKIATQQDLLQMRDEFAVYITVNGDTFKVDKLER